ncbi:MAG: hypothetical protein KHZ62_04310 [Clostridiales bacterium]|nr:hypothetical protein [Clostridiales bacterium]
MRFAKNIWSAEDMNDLATIVYSLRRNIPVLDCFLVCLSPNEKNYFEILSSEELVKERNQKKDYFVVGISIGKKEALQLVMRIFEEAAEQMWDFRNLREEVQKW